MKKRKKWARLGWMLVTFIMIISAVSVPASAAIAGRTSEGVASALNEKLPAVGYVMSNKSRIYACSDATLTHMQTSYYIDVFSDEVVFNEISSDGRAIVLTYPSSSAPGGYRTKWFSTADVLGLDDISISQYVASERNETYRHTAASRLSRTGSVSKGDGVLRLGRHAVAGKSFYVTVYPISTKTTYGLAVKNKLALSPDPGYGTGSTPTQTPSVPATSAETAVMLRLKAICGTGEVTLPNTVLTIGSTFSGVRAKEACKGFGKDTFYLTFGVLPGSTQARGKGLNYLLNDTKGMKLVGSVTDMSEKQIKALFQQARPGDFVQMRRCHTGSHSMIVYSVSGTGVKVLEANTDGKNTIMGNFYTWKDLVQKNAAMSVYTATDYRVS